MRCHCSASTQMLQPFLSAVLFQPAFSPAWHLIRYFCRHRLAEFLKFQNDVGVELQLHPDAFASAIINCFLHHSLMRTPNSPTFLFIVLLSAQKIYRKANSAPNVDALITTSRLECREEIDEQLGRSQKQPTGLWEGEAAIRTIVRQLRSLWHG